MCTVLRERKPSDWFVAWLIVDHGATEKRARRSKNGDWLHIERELLVSSSMLARVQNPPPK